MIDPRITTAFEQQVGFPLEPHLVVLAIMGSDSHGTKLEHEPNAVDDLDLIGFVVPPLEYHMGLPRWEHWTFKQDELDVVLYSLDKAVRLLLKSNPNITGLLWLRPEFYVHRDMTFDRLQSERGVFSSLQVEDAFVGYAQDQLRRMEAFDLDRMLEYEALTQQLRAHGPVQEVLEADARKLKHLAESWNLPLETLTGFRTLHRRHFSGYMGEKRKSLVKKHGYDCKNASHMIRLLRMGTEFLATGELQVFRTDAEELKAIKRGEWTLEQVKAEAERLFASVDVAKQRSPLPAVPDITAANRLLMEVHGDFLGMAIVDG